MNSGVLYIPDNYFLETSSGVEMKCGANVELILNISFEKERAHGPVPCKPESNRYVSGERSEAGDRNRS